MADEMGVVVKHLFEMRHEPFAVDRIAGQSAADMVVNPAEADCGDGFKKAVARGFVAVAQPGAPQRLEERCVGEFRRALKTAVVRVVEAGDAVGETADRLWCQLPGCGTAGELLPQMVLQPCGIGVDIGAALAPGGFHLDQHVRESGPAVARLLREIGAAPKGLAVGRQDHRQGPTALLSHGCQRGHIDLVDIGAFLAVYLDVDVEPVHQLRDLVVLEAFMRHDVAPVAGGVADRQEDRPVERAGGLQCRFVPGLPVDRIVLVLQ